MEDENLIIDGNAKQIPYFRPSIERLRVILMFFMCIDLLGFPTAIGGYVQTICGFVPLAFFVLSGYLVLREDEDRSKRIVRAIKRCAIVFAILAVAYFAINYFYYRFLGVNIFSAFASKRFWFNFVVLNVWQFDIGSAIWYVQALLYAYIIIYFLDKWKLLRFDWLIAAVLIIFTVVTGELAGVFRWEFWGYNYIPGNFLTRAMPYVLLGAFFHRKVKSIVAAWRPLYIIGIFVGIALTVGEIVLLGYLGVPGHYGHLIGMGVTAVSVCMLAFQDDIPETGFEFILDMPRWSINCIYYLCQPMSVGIALLLSDAGKELFAMSVGFMGILTFVVCFFLAWLISRIDLLFLMIRYKDDEEEN